MITFPSYDGTEMAFEDDTDPEIIEKARRLANGITDENADHLPPEFSPRDLNVRPAKVWARDEVRIPLILEDVAEECQRKHINYAHPWCTSRGRDGCGRPYEWAHNSLTRWLARTPGAAVPDIAPVEWSWDGSHLTKQDDAYLTLSQLRDMPEPTWLIKNLVPDKSLGHVVGRDGTYKTFLCIGFAMEVVMNGGSVLFLAGEGVRSFGRRIDAWLEHAGVEWTDEQESRFVVRNGTVDLFKGAKEYDVLLDKVKAEKFDLIVVDTLARSSGSAEQNSASDMSVVTHNTERLKIASEGTLLVVAHTDKGDNDARGSSVIEDSADFVLHLKKKDEAVRLISTKQKDAETGLEWLLAPLQVKDSMVLVPADQVAKPDPVENSHSNENRVLVALAGMIHLDYVSQTQIRAVTGDDGTNKGPINDGTLSKVVNSLVGDGVIEKAPSTKAYRLNKENERALKYIEARS